MEGHQDYMNDFDWVRKIKPPTFKVLGARTKNEEVFETFEEKFEIF